VVRRTVSGQSASLKAQSVYEKANSAITRRFFEELDQNIFAGKLAAQLFRVQTAIRSEQFYEPFLPQANGRSHTGAIRARNAKDARLDDLCDLLEKRRSRLGVGMQSVS